MPQPENINIKLTQPLMQEFSQEEKEQLTRFSFLALKEYPIHTHTHMEIIYVLEGSISVKVGVSDYTLSAGEFTIINPFELHGLSCTEEPNRICLLEISTRFYDPCEEGTIFVSSYGLYHDAAKEDFDKIVEVLKRIFYLHLSSMAESDSPDSYLPMVSHTCNAEYEKILLRSLINYFELHFTAEYFLLSDHRENTLRDNLVQADRLKHILSYFYEHFPQKIQLQDVAEHTYVNRYHISHLVKSGIGFTFSELLQHIRIEKAEIYLLGTDLPISQIVFELGFSSYRYFNQHFKNHFDMTPNAYRKKYQKETILYKDISILSPIEQSEARAQLKLWKMEIVGDALPKVRPKKQMQLVRVPLKSAVSSRPAEAIPESELNWPARHFLYDSPYLPALLLSQMEHCGPAKFITQHPCFWQPDTAESGSATFCQIPGTVTSSGIKKSLYYLQEFLKDLHEKSSSVCSGGFLSVRGDKILFLAYAAPLDIGEVLSRNFSTPPELTGYINTHSPADYQKTISLDFQDFLEESPALIIRQCAIKLELDAFNQWQRIGSPARLSKKTIRLLNEASRPDTVFTRLQLTETACQYEITLNPFEVKLFQISPADAGV